MKKIRTLLQLVAFDKRWITISNGLTVIRLLLALCVPLCVYVGWWHQAVLVFAFAAVTDLLDGFFARMLNEQTHLGTMLDPIADKLLLICSFGSLAFFSSPFFHIPHWFFLIILVRESIMILGSTLLIWYCKDAHIEPLFWGKMTTLLQVLFLMWVFTSYFVGWEPRKTYDVVLVLLTLFSLLSLYYYGKRACMDAYARQ